MFKASVMGLVLFSCMTFSTANSSDSQNNEKNLVSDSSLTSEHLEVYRALLTEWFQNSRFSLNLANQTMPIESSNNSEDNCTEGLNLEIPTTNYVHRFRSEDLAQLGSEHIHLVDPNAGAENVRKNDPGSAIRQGKSVDNAVENGFTHGLFTLGEIRFDHSHTHAVVSFSFVCGRLCGHGSTMRLMKKDGVWKQQKQCGGWIS